MCRKPDETGKNGLAEKRFPATRRCCAQAKSKENGNVSKIAVKGGGEAFFAAVFGLKNVTKCFFCYVDAEQILFG
ncbi:MAG: hypothetical protein LOD87_03490 [Planifilum fulgidum]